MRLSTVFVLGLGLGSAACGSSTSPDDTRTPAAPSIIESFVEQVAVGGFRFFSFSTAQYGTINLTLNSVSGTDVPADVQMGLTLGRPDGTNCATLTNMNTQAGTTPQVSGIYEAGVFCAKIADVGNLTAPAQFDITIAHP